MSKESAVRKRVSETGQRVSFLDMNHTLKWLLKTADECDCHSAIPHLERAQEVILRRKRNLFG